MIEAKPGVRQWRIQLPLLSAFYLYVKNNYGATLGNISMACSPLQFYAGASLSALSLLVPPEVTMASVSFEELHSSSSLWPWNHTLCLDDSFSGLLCDRLQALGSLIPCSLLNSLYSHTSLALSPYAFCSLTHLYPMWGVFRPHYSSSLVMFGGVLCQDILRE